MRTRRTVSTLRSLRKQSSTRVLALSCTLDEEWTRGSPSSQNSGPWRENEPQTHLALLLGRRARAAGVLREVSVRRSRSGGIKGRQLWHWALWEGNPGPGATERGYRGVKWRRDTTVQDLPEEERMTHRAGGTDGVSERASVPGQGFEILLVALSSDTEWRQGSDPQLLRSPGADSSSSLS